MSRLIALAAIGLGLVGCQGLILDPAAEEGRSADREADVADPLTVCESFDVGDLGMRRLTRVEYDHTVRDLLGAAARPGTTLSEDGSAGPFASNSRIKPSETVVDQYRLAAERLAHEVDLSSLLSCDAAAPSCARAFVTRFGRRAFRRPLESAEIDRYVEVFELGATAAGASPEDGARLVVEAMLQSPYFLYLVEVGGEEGEQAIVPLTQHELAARLSYFLWSSMPDAELDAAADAGELATLEALDAQVERMLADDRAADMLDSFHRQWLDTARLDREEKDEALYPTYDDALVRSMWDETRAFVSYVLRSDARFETLLTASYTLGDASMAALYGAGHGGGEGVRRIELDPRQRAGLLTQAAFLTSHSTSTDSSFITRGLFVRERLLCQTVPDPPPDAADNPPDLSETDAPRKEQWSRHLIADECRGCHTMIDPPGFAFEHYDAVGAWREQVGGWDVDPTGELVGAGDADGSFRDALELVRTLAQSQDVQRCYALQWTRFGLAREPAEQDACSVAHVRDAFLESGGDIRELIKAVIRTDAFRFRRAAREGSSS